MCNITIDHGWYAERERAMAALTAQCIASIVKVADAAPGSIAPATKAALDAVLAVYVRAAADHYRATPSDFTRCPECGQSLPQEDQP